MTITAGCGTAGCGTAVKNLEEGALKAMKIQDTVEKQYYPVESVSVVSGIEKENNTVLNLFLEGESGDLNSKVFIKFEQDDFNTTVTIDTIANASLSLFAKTDGLGVCSSINVYGMIDKSKNIKINEFEPDNIPGSFKYITTRTIQKNTDTKCTFDVTEFVNENLGMGNIIFMLETNGLPNFNQHVTFSGLSDQTSKWPTLTLILGKPVKNNIEALLSPIWNSDIITGESVMMVSENGNLPKAGLMFEPEEVLAVTNASLSTEYSFGKDIFYENGYLVLPKDSPIPYVDFRDLYPDKQKPNFKGFVGVDRWLISSPGALWFQQNHLAVTYRKSKESKWKGNIPASAGKTLMGTMAKLKKKEPLKVALLGDSISFGGDASSIYGSSPYLPIWANLVEILLEKKYGSDITLINPSLGGTVASWGKQVARSYITPVKPDLMIIGFGMNGKENPDDFESSISSIIGSASTGNPECEFILVIPMQLNTKWQPLDERLLKAERLRKMANDAVGIKIAVADVWSVHDELLKHKEFYDMSSNNVNHPNDFLVRVYAQVIATALIE